MELKLIEGWQKFWRMWSIRFSAVGTMLLTYLAASPTAIVDAWNMLPSDIKTFIPVKYSLYIAIVLFVLGMFSRVVKQEKLTNGKDEQSDKP